VATVTEFNNAILREVADRYEQVLKARIVMTNQLNAIEKGEDKDYPDPVGIFQWARDTKEELTVKYDAKLEECRDAMVDQVSKHPTYSWLMGIPGINRTLSGRILGMIPMDTEEDFINFSKLRTYAGMAPGKDRHVPGKSSAFNSRLRTVLHILYETVQKCTARNRKSKTTPKPAAYYMDIYKKWNVHYKMLGAEKMANVEAGLWTAKKSKNRFGDIRYTEVKDENGEDVNPAWLTNIHCQMGAKRKMLDVFMCHLWRVWREGLGWSTRELYVHEKLGHQMNYDAKDFSSPEMALRKIKEHK
jgi:hypothetical protein